MNPKVPKDTKDLFFGRPSPATEATAYAVIGAAIEVHSALGPGYSENIYERALMRELEYRDIGFEKQVVLDVLYRGGSVGEHRIDLLVEGRLVVELKAVDRLNLELARQQTLSYLKATGFELGLVLNFHVPAMKLGVHRVIRKWPLEDPTT